MRKTNATAAVTRMAQWRYGYRSVWGSSGPRLESIPSVLEQCTRAERGLVAVR